MKQPKRRRALRATAIRKRPLARNGGLSTPEADPRFSALFDLSAVGTALVGLDGRFLKVNPSLCRMLGYPEEALLSLSLETITHPDDRKASLALRRRMIDEGAGEPTEGRYLHKGGAPLWGRLSLSLVRDPAGAEGYFVAQIQEVTEKKRSEAGLHLLQRITLAVSRAQTFDAALAATLALVCETTGWALGQAWIPREDRSCLDCSPAWHGPAGSLGPFRAASERFAPAPGVGLPGRAWSTGKPAWIEDVTEDSNFPRAAAARKAGLKGAVAIPVFAGEEIIAVIEFFVLERRETDPPLIALISTLASQLGAPFQRKRAEELARREKTLSEGLIRSSMDGIFAFDRGGRYTLWNPAMEEITGMRREEVLGRSVLERLPFSKEAREQEPLKAVLEGKRIVTRDRAYRNLESGRQGLFECHYAPLYNPSGEIVGGIAVVHDVTELKRSEQERAELIREQTARIESEGIQRRLLFLSEAGALLSASLDYTNALSNVARLAVPILADWCIVHMARQDGTLTQIAAAHSDPSKMAMAREWGERFQLTLDPSTEIGRALSAGRSRRYLSIPEEPFEKMISDPEIRRTIRQMNFRSAMIVPLHIRGGLLGMITFASAESGRRFGPADLSLAEQLAHRAAIAVDNALLHEAEQEARQRAERAADRIARLQEVTAALSEALTPEQVADVVVHQGIGALGAAAGMIYLLDQSGTQMERLRLVGYPEETSNRYFRIPMSLAVPLTEAARAGAPIWLESKKTFAALYPHLPQSSGYQAWAAIPLKVEGSIIGAMGLSFSEAQAFSSEDRAFTIALARQCAEALERARLYEAERAARAEAEAAQQRLQFLSEASALLSASLDYETTLEQIARLAVPRLADCCIVDLLDKDGSIRRLAVAHVDRNKEAEIREIRRRHPHDPNAPTGIPELLRTGESSFFPEITDAVIERFAGPHAELRETLRGLSLRSGICTPLRGRGRPMGVLSLWTAESDRRYGPPDVALAEELARRAAVAIENARLYRAAQQEIAERTKAEEKIRFQASLLDMIGQAVVATDPAGTIFYWNRFAERLYGWPASEAIGRNILDVTPASLSREEGERIMARLLRGESWSGEFPVRRRDGTTFPAMVTDSPIYDSGGSLIGIIGVSFDLTERKRAERELEKKRIEAEEANRLKSEFVSNMSHELRTPLNAIIGYSSLLLYRTFGEIAPRQQEALLSLQRNAKSLLNLINDLLDLSRIESGKMPLILDAVDLKSLLPGLFGEVHPLLQGKPVEVVWKIGKRVAPIRSDPQKIRQIFLNLLSNAIKFTDAGTITISVAPAKRRKGILLSVEDTGIGMKEEDLPMIFDPFRQIDGSLTRQAGGTGLGLAIVKNAVALIQGTIEVRSSYGKGSTFTLYLPDLSNADCGARIAG